MSSVKAVEEAFKLAVDRALCAASREPLARIEGGGRADAVGRIDIAMNEVDKLRTLEQQPDYSDRDVALFYTQWYLPQQINITYSESTRVLSQAASPNGRTLQLVDFGAGTGAMVIGLSLAIANRPKTEWPEYIVVYQIDQPAMLELGTEIWRHIHAWSRRYPILRDLAEVMDRALFDQVPLSSDGSCDMIPIWEDARRWLTAIHVVYRDDMETINSEVQSLSNRLRPHVQMRTAPSFKARYLGVDEEVNDIRQSLRGWVPGITSLRRDVWSYTGAVLSQESHRYLNYLHGWVSWTNNGVRNAPSAATVHGAGAERYG